MSEVTGSGTGGTRLQVLRLDSLTNAKGALSLSKGYLGSPTRPRLAVSAELPGGSAEGGRASVCV
jgi:hypothetical protein